MPLQNTGQQNGWKLEEYYTDNNSGTGVSKTNGTVFYSFDDGATIMSSSSEPTVTAALAGGAVIMSVFNDANDTDFISNVTNTGSCPV